MTQPNELLGFDMSRTHKTAIVAIPPDNVWEPIQAIREIHDRKIHRWMPHITLIYPFCPETEFEAAASELTSACRDLCPIKVTLSTFQTFSHGKGHFTVWLKPEPTEPLLDLHAALWTAVSYEQDFEPRIGRFVPHLSVGQVRGRAERDRLVEELQAAWRPVQFTLTAVHLISRGDPPDDVFSVVKTIQLGDPAHKPQAPNRK